MGFCPQCRAGAGLVEQSDVPSGRRERTAVAVALDEACRTEPGSIATGLEEVDRVLGGGLVPGSAVVVGGEPGVGKSTLLLQVAAGVAQHPTGVVVASAEESVAQVALRARRLGVGGSGRIDILDAGDVDAVVAAAHSLQADLLIVDSIQTVVAADLGSAAGGAAQVRECASRLLRFAKSTGCAVILVGHVTKDGSIAGPKLLEHMVDVVLYLEGDDEAGLRLLRCLKNRFGESHRVGILEMTGGGLEPVLDPSRLLVSQRSAGAAGTVVYPAIHGRRPVLVEVQALVTPPAGSHVRRSVQGLDAARVDQILAVLARHGGLTTQGHDVYVGVVGGLRIREPAADLAVALAVASSLTGIPLGAVAAFGEVSLTGEVRPVAHARRRRREAARLGFDEVVAPQGGRESSLGTLIRIVRLVS